MGTSSPTLLGRLSRWWSTPAAKTARQLTARLPRLDPSRLSDLRAQVAERPIKYPFGAGQAEEIALAAGLKPVVRQFLPRSEVEAARARYEAQGYTVCVVETRDLPYDGVCFHVGRDAARTKEAARLDSEVDRHEAALGKALGFPPCCIDVFTRITKPRRIGKFHAASLAHTHGRCDPRLNVLDLTVFHYLSWIPCSLDCAPSKEYADRLHDAVLHSRPTRAGPTLGHRDADPGIAAFLEGMDRTLAAPRLFLADDLQLSFEGTAESGQLKIDRVWPTARDRHPSVPLPAEAVDAVAALWSVLEQASTLAIDGDVLLLDERPLFRWPTPVLVPFTRR